MQYLGEFLSPQNSISLDQDKLIKYFYFRPDQYEDPDADLENIFIIKSMDEFPKRYDKLAENTKYAIDTIEVSKRISDEAVGVKKVSYVVTATYDLLSNIKNRENTGADENEEEEDVDQDGNTVTSETPPWKLRPEFSFNPIEVVIPFIKAYDPVTGVQTVDVVNSAGTRLIAETKKYQLEITYTCSYKYTESMFDNILDCFTNSFPVDLGWDGRPPFGIGTLLLLPPTCTKQYWKGKESESSEEKLHPYYTYTIKMVYNPDGWKKKLLNIGTFAKFSSDGIAEQIWKVTVANENGALLAGFPQWVSNSKAIEIKAQHQDNGNIFSAEAETNPLPLTETGAIFLNAMKDPVKNPYLTREFVQYQETDFNDLPFKGM